MAKLHVMNFYPQ